MENVPEVVGSGNIQHFKKWEEQLRKFGYSNYVEILNGKNYGIPQNRRRCFMVSILGDYAYDFPCKMPLKHFLEDFKDKDVAAEYFIKQKTILDISEWNSFEKPLESNSVERERERVVPTLTTRTSQLTGSMIITATKLSGGS